MRDYCGTVPKSVTSVRTQAITSIPCGLIPVTRTHKITADFLWPEKKLMTTRCRCSASELQVYSPSLLAPTQPPLMAGKRGTKSLQCLTESTSQDDLAQVYCLKEKRFVETVNPTMDEKLESMLQCIEMPQSDRSSLHLEAFSNEGEIMQLDSSETQSFEEFDATNITGKVVGADKSCTTISHLEDKNTIETLERKCRIAEDEISLEVLQQNFGHKRLDVAKKLGVSVSTLKRVMRKHGIRRWPFRNKKIECSLFEPKLVTEFVHGAVGSFSPPTSSHTDVVGSSYPSSQGSKPPEPRIEKRMSSSFGGQARIADQMLERNLSAHEGQLQEQNRFHLHRQDARVVTLKATYGKIIVKLKLSSTSGIVELKEELAKKLELEHGSFNVNYQDEDLEWILITCDADLYDCVTSSTSMGNQVIRLLVLDKVVNSKNSNKAAEH